MEAIVLRYGLVAIFFGAAIEGEPFALAGGVLAHRGWLSPWSAGAATIGGAIFIDQLWFHLSRRFRDARMVQSVIRRPAFAKSLGLVERHPVPFLLLFRFAYGLRSVAPVAIGASRVPGRLFVPLDLAASVVWGALFTWLGMLAGPGFEALEARYGPAVTLVTIGVSALVLVLALRKGRG